MEDTKVFPGLFAYQFRVDIHEDNTILNDFMQHYNIKYFICGHEISDNNKPHYQCILWFDKKQDSSKLRNWWKGKTLPTKQPVSFTSAKKIKSLGKYTMKDGNYLTNLSNQQINDIGKWKKSVKLQEWNDKVHVEIERYTEEMVHCLNFSKTAYIKEFIIHLISFYRIHNRRPMRSHIQYLAWKHGYISDTEIAFDWFSFK